jgi:uncharacterized protein
MFKEGTSKVLISLMVVVALVLLWRGSNVTVNTGTQDRIISVSSTATIETQPDKAELYLNIETLGNDAQQSQVNNSVVSSKVISALTAAGISKSDISTSQYSLQQRIKYGKEYEQIFEGYSTTHVLKISTANVDDVGSLIDAGISNGANGINDIVFTLTDAKQAELKSEAIANASVEARYKAQKIADGLGVKLGKLNTAYESSYNYRPYAPNVAMYDKVTAAGAEPAPTSVLPQTVEVDVTLSVTYEIK